MNPGTKLGPYQITDQLGRGGMGEVYRATDTRLDRTVAIKVLPEDVASDPQRRQRFEREAKAVSSLNHPHICTLHDVGEQDGTHYLVMELVEGETLEARIQKGRLPLDKALEYAIQIADALDKAHRQGVVHRDLKPANIMLTKAGVKLLDFGLAKLKGDAGAISPMSQMATQEEGLTAEGTILGTLQYMAPEQLEGKDADSRTDIFAFGAVVYETVTGRKAFEGKSQASLIHAIMGVDPQPMARLQELTPKALDHVIERCLEKEPESRWQTAADLARELQWCGTLGPEVQGALPSPVGSRTSRLWAAATAGLVVVAGVLGVMLLRPLPQAPEIRTDILTPAGPNPLDFALSPDGSRIVYAAYDDDSVPRLMLRRLDLDVGSVQPLAGTENAITPFWSPDSRSVGFVADGWIQTMDLDTRSVRQVASANKGGVNWDPSSILYPGDGGGLFSVAPAGGADPFRLDIGTHNDVFASSSLHSRGAVLFYDRNTRKVYAARLDGAEAPRELTEADGTAVFLPPNTLLYVSQGTLYARDFEPRSLELDDGPAGVLATNIVTAYGRAALSASDNGMIAYRTRLTTPTPRFVWVDRNGNTVGVAGEPKGVLAGTLELSANDRSVVFEQETTENGEIRLYSMDLARPGAPPTELTSGDLRDAQATLSPDGAFLSFLRGNFEVHVTSLTGAVNPTRSILPSETAMPTDWSPDGRWLLYQSRANDLWVLPMNAGEPAGDPVPVVNSSYNDSWGQFSPDGRWIAFESDRDGQHQIYLTPFPEGGQVTSVTKNGGTQVRWNPEGTGLFFIALDGQFSEVPVRLPNGGEGAPEVAEPVALFMAPIGSLNFRGQQYDVSADGQRFLMNMPRDANSAITMLMNWNQGDR